MIKVENLTFFYKKSDKPSIKNISLSVSRGESLVIMGHSGAGKSTLLLTFNGVIPKFLKGKFEGKVIIDSINTESSSVPELSAKVGIVFQDFESQLFSTNVELEAAFLPENLGIGRSTMKERVKKYIAFVGLSDFMKRQPAELSGGEKQRLAIASVLTGEPVILCLDEPTTDLDSDGKKRVIEIAKSLQDEKDTTLIMVEHD
ncbi:energy-coupling factor ABC transporter ATP-binding protein, partial [bacterium]|nr:energy-coupling factor ABC transporter ATP-binding protein [bacterium]